MAASKTLQIIAGSIFHFAPVGGTVTSTAVPVDTGLTFDATTAPWVLLGTVQDSTVTPTIESKELTACSPGLRTTVKKVPVKVTVDIGFTLGEINDTVRDLLFVEDSAGGILSGVAQLEGWLRFEIYDEANQAMDKRIAYGALTVDGAVNLGEDFVKPKFKFTVYKNAENATTRPAA